MSTKGKVVAHSRRARYDYEISETYEAGLMLTGTEVKSLRAGQASLNEAYAGERDGAFFLFNATISEYKQASRFNHEPKRPRKLLLRRKEMHKLFGALKRKGITLVPISIYFNHRGCAKLEIGVGQGKKEIDKRETIKERDWQRQKSRLMREH